MQYDGDTCLPASYLVDALAEARAYEFQTSGVIEMFEKLLDGFIAERTTFETEHLMALYHTGSHRAWRLFLQLSNPQMIGSAQQQFCTV